MCSQRWKRKRWRLQCAAPCSCSSRKMTASWTTPSIRGPLIPPRGSCFRWKPARASRTPSITARQATETETEKMTGGFRVWRNSTHADNFLIFVALLKSSIVRRTGDQDCDYNDKFVKQYDYKQILPSMLSALTLKPSSLLISKRRCGWFMYILFLCLGAGASSSELKPVESFSRSFTESKTTLTEN